MAETMEKLGVEMSAEKILRYAVKDVKNAELIEESVTLLGEYFSSEMLAKIVSDLQSVVGVDGLTKRETSSIDQLIQAWQVEEEEEEEEDEEGEEEEDEGEDEDEEEDEEEDDEGEEDEEDEDEDEDEDEEEEEEEEEEAPKKRGRK
jgi:hypothetical protein